MARALCACFLAVAVCATLAACYPSEFLTQVVIDSSSQTTDDDMSRAMQVNSPDAKTEANNLSALDISKKAKNTTDEENRVVYKSKDTNVDDMSAHHSIFDLEPRLPGIEASDGVSFKLADDTEKKWLDHEVSGKTKTKDAKSKGKDKSKQKKGKSKSQKESAKKKNSGSDAKTSGKASGKSSQKNKNKKSGGSSKKNSGTDNGKDKGDNSDPNKKDDGGNADADDDGSSPVTSNQTWKTGQLEPIYDPDNERSQLKKADHVAATGQAAVLVQAIGGHGALCAMDESTYNGKDSDGYKTTTSAFKDVFKEGDNAELAKGFKEAALQWSGDGSSSSDVKSIKKLIKTIGADGVLFYEGDKASASDRFTDNMRSALKTAGIQLVPLDLSTVQGILDAASAVGEVLSQSKDLSEGWSSADMAKKYAEAVTNIVTAVADVQDNIPGTQGGAYRVSVDKLLKTAWSDCPISVSNANSGTYITSVIATAYDDSVAYSSAASGYEFDVSDGVFFAESDGRSPLSFWLQVAGTRDSSSFGVYDTLDTKHKNGNYFNSKYFPIIPVFTPYGQKVGVKASFSYGSNSPFSQVNWDRIVDQQKQGFADELVCLTANDPVGGMSHTYMGVGSQYTPYFIVCAYKDRTASDAKDALVKAMKNEDSFYYAHPDNGCYLKIKKANGNGTQSALSLIGTQWTDSTSGGKGKNAIGSTGIKESDVVVENPCGLLGSWTGATMESVLESVWAANLYSQKANGSDYEPNSHMDKFSVKIAGTECNTLQEAVKTFYNTFYRYSLTDKGYKKVVTEEGPGN